MPAMSAAPGLFPFATEMILMGTVRTAAAGPRLSAEPRRAAPAAAVALTHARAAGQHRDGRSRVSVVRD